MYNFCPFSTEYTHWLSVYYISFGPLKTDFKKGTFLLSAPLVFRIRGEGFHCDCFER